MKADFLKIKLSKGQIFTVSAMLIALTSISYQIYLIRRKQKSGTTFSEVLFVHSED
jgi:uncharacterized protein YoxC